MSEILISYTSSDRDWAFWIGQEIEKLGHIAHIHAWEIAAGEDISRWMMERHSRADHILCVISESYLGEPYASWEHRIAEWAAQTDRHSFALPVRIEDCKLPTLFASARRCDLFDLDEDDARARLMDFLKPAGRPSTPVPFPGTKGPPPRARYVQFPGRAEQSFAISNVPINVPRHFLGRDASLSAIHAALRAKSGPTAIVALYGLLGVGKTTLAAAYAERLRSEYRVTWWIRAETESTMRADLFGLGIRMGWASADMPEEQAVATVLERLRSDGEGILLIYDKAVTLSDLARFLPSAAYLHIIIISNAPNWRATAVPIEIGIWPKNVGADFLVARTGQVSEKAAALALSEALEGLPLVHEQAAAYCERMGIALAEYLKKFVATPAAIIDSLLSASEQHHGLTAAKAFVLAIKEAGKLQPAAEPLISYAAMLAAEPIPLYLFSEGRESFGEGFSAAIVDDGLNEAVAALRTFALIDRESIADERDPSVMTDSIRLHPLVRQIVASRLSPAAKSKVQRELLEAVARVYPARVHSDPRTWLRARRLDAIAVDLLAGDDLHEGAEIATANLLSKLEAYRGAAQASYSEARFLSERALAIREKTLGLGHPDTILNLNNLGYLLQKQGDTAGARPLFERALAIGEKELGMDHPIVAMSLNNLGALLRAQGDLAAARPYYERALAVREKMLGPDHPDTANSLNNLGYVLQAQGNLATARPYYERALAIREKTFGPNHSETANSLNNLGALLLEQGDIEGARPNYERALAIREKALGPDDPVTATSLNAIGYLLQAQGDFAGALSYYERALTILESALGEEHPDTALGLYNLGHLLQYQGALTDARPRFERALIIFEKKLGISHPDTRVVASNTADLLGKLDLPKEAAAIRKKFGVDEKI